MTPAIQYVLGFLFDTNLERVVLIRKTKPKWQSGLLNGVGGKVHTHEESDAAMRREFKEETGSSVTEWHPFARLNGPDWIVNCYCAVADALRVENTTDEQVEIAEVNSLSARRDLLDNVAWLVLAARENWWSAASPVIEVRYETEVAA
jgi:8-oxo-dGTP diphosphatase